MTVTDVLALIGAVTGIIGTVAGISALGWDYYKWRFAERVQLRVSAVPNFLSTDNPHEPMIWVHITNVGKISTKIHNISIQGFDKKPTKKKRHGDKIAIVRQILYNQLPVMLHPGEDWSGGIRQNTPDIQEFTTFKYFIVSIEDSVSDWPFRAEVDKTSLMKYTPSA